MSICTHRTVLVFMTLVAAVHGILGPNQVHMDQQRQARVVDGVKKVHIIFMNHLDVGYDGIPLTGFINNIVNIYFHEYFPQAISLSESLRSGGYVERFVYTTHPWLVSLYVNCPPDLVMSGVKLLCPNATERAKFNKAVANGDITWHAGPMNMQIENMDASLLEFSLNVSANLDAMYGIQRKYRTLSQRDVPGMTQAVIPSLVKMGIVAVAVGVNNMTPPPALPNPFVWKFGNAEVIGTWHKGGYPDNPGPYPAQPGGLSVDDCVVVPGFTDVLCFSFRTDNSGPPMNVAEVLNSYEILRKEFPGAQLQASTLEQYIEALQPIKSKLPVVMQEVGDTWITGVASDPKKMAEYRAIARVLKACVASGGCQYTDARVVNASRFLTKPPEHTWGLPSVFDTIHWSNEQFSKVKLGKNFMNCDNGWTEQRRFNQLTLDALGNHSVVTKMKQALMELVPREPLLDGYTETADKAKTFTCGSMQVAFAMDGSLSTLNYNGTKWASTANPLGKFIYYTYNEVDFAEFGRLYNYNGRSAGFYKNNCTENAHPESRDWPTSMQELYQKNDGSCDFYVHILMVDTVCWTWYGAPRELWLRYQPRTTPTPGVDITVQLFDKTSTRLPEALMYSFKPAPQVSHKWFVSKLGRLVDPMNVILNGSQYQHVADDNGVYYMNPATTHGLRISSPDIPLVCPFTVNNRPTAFPAPLKPINSTITGMAFNLYNNIWDTNYILWYPFVKGDQDFKARFSIDIMLKKDKSLHVKLDALRR